jgi:adenylate cyclase
MRKHWLRIALGVALALLFLAHAAGWARIGLIDKLETVVYDTRLRLTMPRTLDERIVIVDIDEKSLAERERGGEGRWPWPRDRLAALVDKLFERYRIALLGFDFVFPERDESSGIRVLERLAANELRHVTPFRAALDEIKPQLDFDAIFADRIRGRPVVLGYTFVPEESAKGVLPPPVLTAAAFDGHAPAAMRFPGYTANLATLQNAAASAGHFNPAEDADGIVRRVPMLIEHDGAYYEPLAAAMLRLLAGKPEVKALLDVSATDEPAALESVEVGPYRIPVDGEAAALVPYRGPRGSFRYYSATDVLNDRVDPAALESRIVLVGTSALGLLDMRATPVEPVFPGVEIHANLLAGMLDRNIKHQPPYAIGAEGLILLITGLVLALWLPRLSPQRVTLVTLTALVLVLAVNIWFFLYEHLVLPVASQAVLIGLLFTLNAAWGFFVEARGRRQITSLFGQYVPPAVVDEMTAADDPETFSMEGQSREMTVLFTDVRSFTTIAERLEPKVLSHLMNEFLTPLTEVIYKHRGTIDKYMGDCIMAFWGAPLVDPSHARNAVLASLEMQRTLKGIQPQFTARGWPEIRIGVGVNSGRMSVGNMGSRVRRAYTVMGDAVNIASRLEGITKEYGADIIVGEDVRKAVTDVVFREVDRVRLKGRDTALTIYEPLGLSGEVPDSMLAEAALFHTALEHYRNQDWQMAERNLRELAAMSPGTRLYETFLERIALLRSHPPASAWDGAYTFQTKHA